MILLCDRLDVLLSLLCSALLCSVAIKPEPDKVEHHYRNRHKTTREPLRAVIAIAESFYIIIPAPDSSHYPCFPLSLEKGSAVMARPPITEASRRNPVYQVNYYDRD
ncbi:uncharacterized protein BKA55DRAFT_542500 [Fusarium redolens]|uniref:Secreted protein n=1 Tax=Fusarium redolens TaxID=48865 RepID=A0A9P9GI19_FUSRE|nr:uncharacterized protein BKA55DRAFT_542500 [Fusarium redolens]KAH7239899.1 hypothetical protein BKA55DRAFT_542500 [Fusarium redolens]